MAKEKARCLDCGRVFAFERKGDKPRSLCDECKKERIRATNQRYYERVKAARSENKILGSTKTRCLDCGREFIYERKGDKPRSLCDECRKERTRASKQRHDEMVKIARRIEKEREAKKARAGIISEETRKGLRVAAIKGNESRWGAKGTMSLIRKKRIEMRAEAEARMLARERLAIETHKSYGRIVAEQWMMQMKG